MKEIKEMNQMYKTKEMNKGVNMIGVVFLVVFMLILSTKAFSAGYPLLIVKNGIAKATVGDTVTVSYTYFPEYKNERMDVEILDRNNKVVATNSRDFYNTSILSRNYSFSWNTAGMAPGQYTVQVHKCFYSYFRWNESPSPTTSFIILSCRHNWVNGNVIHQPDCVHEGGRSAKCSLCGEARTNSIPATGIHTWNGGSVTTSPTETTEGVATYSCRTCGAAYTTAIPKLDPVTIPKTPASVKASMNKNEVTVTWKEIKKAKKTKALLQKIKAVQVQYSTDPLFLQNTKTKSAGKNKTKIALKLKGKNTYYIRIRYRGKGGVSKWSRVIKARVK